MRRVPPRPPWRRARSKAHAPEHRTLRRQRACDAAHHPPQSMFYGEMAACEERGGVGMEVGAALLPTARGGGASAVLF